MRNLLTSALLICLATPAIARDYCPERPGIGTPPCTIDPGKLSVEVAGADWTLDNAPDARTDTLLLGDFALRYGIADHTELRLGWTPYGHVRMRDKIMGAIDRLDGVGDVTLGLKRNLIDPEGDGFSIALLPSISLPAGGQAIGAGDWGASLAMPLSLPLGERVSLGLTPQIDAAVNEDRHGRHLSYDVAGGFTIAASDKVSLAIEAEVLRDEDPADITTQAIAGASVGLMLSENVQIDGGVEIALNRDAPDAHAYVGLSRRF